MNKAGLVDVVASKTNFTKKDSTAAVDAFIAAVTEALSKGESVQLVGFGTFEVRKRAAHEGVNPKTRAKIMIAASNNVGFKAGKNLKDAVNG
ncbi:MAG: HU family DNA-binding protein [Clostridiales bacterium]|jgi:DNA-binding protein HU-beta|nr:HU family DNA-binding protein [Clostridiales bacterium]